MQRRRWTRYDLSWVRSDDEHMVTYEAGDFVTRNLAGNSAVRMAGVQISRDFSVRPDVVTYPLPAFAGQAALPSAIELFIDGYRAAAANVGPGNFTVGANPGLNGAGEATLAVTDTLGRRQTTTMPFYVANDLLRPGLFDYSVALGALRRGYGVRSFSYGPVAGMAAARYGLTSFITAEGSLEAGDGRVNASLGGLVQLGLLGVANANLAVSNAHGNVGWRLTTGYQYRTRRLGVVASHMRESADFVDFAEMPFSRNARRVTTVAASLSTDRVGSFGVSYVDSRGNRTGRASLLGSSWSLPIARGVAIYGSGTYDVRRSGWSASFSLILPLGGRKGTAAVGISRDVDGGRTGRFDYGRAVPSEGGLGGSLSLARSSSAGMFGSGEVDWRTGSFDLRGGIFGGRGQVTPWAGASGSLVLMDGAVFAANHIADAFALVSTDGEEGVPVTYENQLVGKTDRGGHLLVPWVPSYYGAHYAINPLVLPAEAVAPKVEDRMAVARGAGAVLRFPISRPRMARVTLVDQAGSFVPVGALASINGGEPQVVGWDGLLFLADTQDRNLISVALPDGGHCTAQLAAPSNQGDASLTGPVTCR
ncbi:MAG: fimbrial assembly protein [Sphingomonas sanxanigenens]|uniref:Fimbrial assembly protein n=1 Tax=Sphingomonas sanxanigenens TaxID=397260 RepID=A0A2W5A3M2_9SPHN|nr:MAG: fimbrial assembly protein [Sphingomonas sanxanigenens]